MTALTHALKYASLAASRGKRDFIVCTTGSTYYVRDRAKNIAPGAWVVAIVVPPRFDWPHSQQYLAAA